MNDFFRQRGKSLALAVLVMVAIALTQGVISYTLTLGGMRERLGVHIPGLVLVGRVLRIGVITLLITLWLLGRKRALFRLIVLATAVDTAVLVADTLTLTTVLSGLTSRAIDELLVDVFLMALANVLIFSIWYWIIDPPGIEGEALDDKPWAFLFPQRAGALPHFEGWAPHYADYLFVAFITSLVFSPTDAPPLTRTAKLLMLLQSAISVVALTAIAGSAINILGSN